jgi:hypothetical protein
MISYKINLFGWSFCDVGCFRCMLIRYIELRLFVNMYVGSRLVVLIFRASCMVVSSTHSMFCNHGSLTKIFIFLSLLYMP